jgi:large subunit ribosomal protein L10
MCAGGSFNRPQTVFFGLGASFWFSVFSLDTLQTLKKGGKLLPITRAKKEEEVAIIQQILADSTSLVVAVNAGLTVDKINDLRKQCREAGVTYRVSKNTMVKLALKGTGMEDLGEYLNGPTAIAFGGEDASAPARVLSEFAKENDKLEVRAGAIEGEVVGIDRIKYLASLGTRDDVLARVLGGIQAPATNIAMNLQGLHRKLLGLFTAYKEKLEATG